MLAAIKASASDAPERGREGCGTRIAVLASLPRRERGQEEGVESEKALPFWFILTDGIG